MNNIRVLLADDVPAIRTLVRKALQRSGKPFEVIGEVGDGAQAVEVAASEKPDAVVLDLSMPVMDGLEAIPQIKNRSPETKILVFSGFEDSQMSEQVESLGADAYISKGVGIRDLADALFLLCTE